MLNLWRFHCSECEGFAKDLQDAWQSDQQSLRTHFFRAAQSTGRDPERFLRQWIMSLAQMPDEELESLHRAHYPRVAEVRLKWKDHERLTGHSVLRNGWRSAFIFNVVRSGYGFLKGSV